MCWNLNIQLKNNKSAEWINMKRWFCFVSFVSKWSLCRWDHNIVTCSEARRTSFSVSTLVLRCLEINHTHKGTRKSVLMRCSKWERSNNIELHRRPSYVWPRLSPTQVLKDPWEREWDFIATDLSFMYDQTVKDLIRYLQVERKIFIN